ncbi:MAG: ATP-binding protein [Myxococcota bacterium]
MLSSFQINTVAIGLYLLLTFFVGVLASRSMTTVRQYAVGSGAYGTSALVCTIFATEIGGISTIGLVGGIFGFAAVPAVLGRVCSQLLIAWLFAPHVARFRDAVSVGEIAGKLYGILGRITMGCACMVLCVCIVGVQVAAMVTVFQQFFELYQPWTALLGFAILVVYSCLGGAVAVTLTDVVQFVITVIAVPMICLFWLWYIGGYGSLSSLVLSQYPQLFATHASWFWYATLFLIFCTPSPPLMQRLLMAQDAAQMMRAFRIAALLQLIFYLLMGLIGLVILTISNSWQPSIVLSYAMNQALPASTKGLVVVSFLAIIMSTADSHLHVAAVSFVHDVVRPVYERCCSHTWLNRNQLGLMQFTTLLLALLILTLKLYGQGVVGVAFGLKDTSYFVCIIPVCVGMLGYRGSPRTFVMAVTFASMLTVAVVGLVGLHMAYGILAALVVSCVVFFFARQYDKPVDMHRCPDFDPTAAQLHITPIWRLPVWSKTRQLCYDYLPTPRNIVQFCTKHVDVHGAMYELFAAYTLIGCLLPLFMRFSETVRGMTVVLGVVPAVLCAFMLVRHQVPGTLFGKYLPVTWFVTLLLAWPLRGTYELLCYTKNNIQLGFWLWVVGFLVCSLVVSLRAFVWVSLLGTLLGSFLYRFSEGENSIVWILMQITPQSILFGVAVIITGLLLTHSRERIRRHRENVLKQFDAAVGHELEKPLQNVQLATVTLQNAMAHLRQSHHEPNQNSRLHQEDEAIIQEQLDVIARVSREGQVVVQMLLMKLKENPAFGKRFDWISMQQCLQAALRDYPFKFGERDRLKVYWGKSIDFLFLGNRELIKHVIYNLIKNALYYTRSRRGDSKSRVKQVHIWFKKSGKEGVLYMRDTGDGIASWALPYVFDRFFTLTEGGCGLGLFFSKEVMRLHKGDILADSIQGEFTQFELILPLERSLEKDR